MSQFWADLGVRFNATFILQNRWEFFVQGLGMTLLLTVASFIGGTILGAGLCALRFTKSKKINVIVEKFVGLLIQIPTMVFLMVFAYIIFNDTSLSIVIVAIFALLLKCSAYLSDIFYTALDNLNKSEAEAARTLGMSAIKTFLYVTLPQAVESALPLYQNQFVIALQETSLVGTLAILDITKASNIVQARTLDAFFGLLLICVVYLIIGFIGVKLIGLIRAKKHLGEE